ncbi:hypothetical protein AAD018_011490 [Aestuariibius insulae]|uniref:head-tail joining protein n=1 Tax=Aestuariibius insulae TaxID=2058287 RepID=UPI00345E44F2
MSVFSAAMDVIFTNPAMAVEAVWTSADEAQSRPVRLIWKRPDEELSFGQAQIVAETAVADIRVLDLASPRQGDRLAIGALLYEVIGDPRRDREGLIWTMDLTPL